MHVRITPRVLVRYNAPRAGSTLESTVERSTWKPCLAQMVTPIAASTELH